MVYVGYWYWFDYLGGWYVMADLSFDEVVALALSIDPLAEVHETGTIPSYYIIYTSFKVGSN
jgi:hypothetical protein